MGAFRVLSLALLLALASAAVTPVDQQVCDDLKTFLQEPNNPGTSIPKSTEDRNRNLATANLVALNESPQSGICLSFDSNQNSCCSPDTEETEFSNLLQGVQDGWADSMDDIDLSSEVFEADSPSELFGINSPRGNPGSGDDSSFNLFGWIESYYQSRNGGATKAVATATITAEIQQSLAGTYADLAGDAYCGVIGNDVGCACDDATWLPAVLAYAPVKARVDLLLNAVSTLSEALYQFFVAIRSIKSVLTIVKAYIPSEDCAKYAFAEARCNYCYGLGDLKPCPGLCYGKFRVCFGALVQLVDPSWKRGIDALVNAITRMGSSAMQFAQLATLPDISCPTCAQYSPLVDIAAATCATGQITLAKSGYCENRWCASSSRRSITNAGLESAATSARRAVDIVQSSFLRSTSKVSRRTVAVANDNTTESDADSLKAVRNLFSSLESQVCTAASDEYAPTNNNCWKGTIDLQNGNRGLFVAGVKAKKTALTEQINNAADAIVKGDLEDQLDSVEQADIVDDFGVSGSGAVFVYDTADVEAALPSLSAELSALDDASSASASFAGASSASSVFVSASLLVAAALISLFLF